MSCDIVFLEASDEVLIRRYSENRRRHPIAKPGETTADAIQRERLQLQGVRDRADMIIDTSRLRTSALRNKLRMAFSELSDQQLMDVHVFSFGFKHGMPVEADIMIDVRFLPNPFYDPEMRTMTGLDKRVSDFVFDHPKTQEFWKALTPAARYSHAGLYRRGQAAAFYCHRLHGRSTPQRCHRRGHGTLFGRRPVSREHFPS